MSQRGPYAKQPAEQKAAIIASLVSFWETNGKRLPEPVVAQFSDLTGVGKRTIRRWAAEGIEAATQPDEPQPQPDNEDPPSEKSARAAFEIREKHLIAIRSHLNLKDAWSELFPDEMKGSPGWVSYPTFARAFSRVPAPIRDGILNGWDAMVTKQTYLSMVAPHRNHTWHLDHTEADVWVHLGRGQIVRPWVSQVRDSATGMRLAAVVYAGRPNEDSICDTLATAARERTYWHNGRRVTVGGRPVQIVLDNAAEHFAEAVTKGALLLGVIINPTMAYHKQQNGQAESTFSGLNKQLFKKLPGYTKGGMGDDGQPLIAPKYADQVDPTKVLQIEVFQDELDTWLVDKNQECRMHRLGNQVPLQAWVDDPTPISTVDEKNLRAMMLRASKPHAVNAEGVRFRSVDYLAPELNYYRDRGLRVEVRYLKRETRWIEVFFEGDWVCTAVDRNLVTPQDKQALLGNRAKDLDLLKRINHAANQDRLHRHMAGSDSAYDDQNDELDPTLIDPVEETVASVTDIKSKAKSKPDAKPASQPTATQEQPAQSAPPLPREDPTTPRRTRRSPAPSNTETDERRKQARMRKGYDRISKRPGANFGEED